MNIGNKVNFRMFMLNNMIYDYIGSQTTKFIWDEISTTTWIHVRDLTDINLKL